MTDPDLKTLGETIYQNLRLRTLPVAAKFLPAEGDLPEKARRPARDLKKRVTVCQAMSMARLYGWTVGLTKEDLICVPMMLAFGLTKARDAKNLLGRLFCGANWTQNEELAASEMEGMNFASTGEFQAIALAPLAKAAFQPDTVTVYGNPAQIMRLIQGWTYVKGRLAPGWFGGKVECNEYLLAPHLTQEARVVVPGMGDRIMSMTQDDEMVMALPGRDVADVVWGMEKAGDKIGARYPVTFYLNFQPEFPKMYKELGEEAGAF